MIQDNYDNNAMPIKEATKVVGEKPLKKPRVFFLISLGKKRWSTRQSQPGQWWEKPTSQPLPPFKRKTLLEILQPIFFIQVSSILSYSLKFLVTISVVGGGLLVKVETVNH